MLIANILGVVASLVTLVIGKTVSNDLRQQHLLTIDWTGLKLGVKNEWAGARETAKPVYANEFPDERRTRFYIYF